jgi:hypothetical protein
MKTDYKMFNNLKVVAGVARTAMLLCLVVAFACNPLPKSSRDKLIERAGKFYTLMGSEQFDEAALYVVPDKREAWLTMMATVSPFVKSQSIEITGLKKSGDNAVDVNLKFVLIRFQEGKAINKVEKQATQQWILQEGQWFFLPKEQI